MCSLQCVSPSKSVLILKLWPSHIYVFLVNLFLGFFPGYGRNVFFFFCMILSFRRCSNKWVEFLPYSRVLQWCCTHMCLLLRCRQQAYLELFCSSTGGSWWPRCCCLGKDIVNRICSSRVSLSILYCITVLYQLNSHVQYICTFEVNMIFTPEKSPSPSSFCGLKEVNK